MASPITESSLQMSRVSSSMLGIAPVAPNHLRLIRGGLDVPERDRSLPVVVAGVVMVLCVVLGLRALQGQPPASLFDDRAAHTAVAPASGGETIHVVAEGDTLWAIAEGLAPGRDPRPVVDALAARNGGTALRAGDLLVIPAEALGAEATSVAATGGAGGSVEQAAP